MTLFRLSQVRRFFCCLHIYHYVPKYIYTYILHINISLKRCLYFGTEWYTVLVGIMFIRRVISVIAAIPYVWTLTNTLRWFDDWISHSCSSPAPLPQKKNFSTYCIPLPLMLRAPNPLVANSINNKYSYVFIRRTYVGDLFNTADRYVCIARTLVCTSSSSSWSRITAAVVAWQQHHLLACCSPGPGYVAQ